MTTDDRYFVRAHDGWGIGQGPTRDKAVRDALQMAAFELESRHQRGELRDPTPIKATVYLVGGGGLFKFNRKGEVVPPEGSDPEEIETITLLVPTRTQDLQPGDRIYDGVFYQEVSHLQQRGWGCEVVHENGDILMAYEDSWIGVLGEEV